MNRKDHKMVVGIGASAGGLKSLEGLLRALPERTGMAFIVVTHLPQDYKSALHTILARYTAMPVIVPAQGEAIRANHVYVCPASQVLTVRRNRLRLAPRPSNHQSFVIDQMLMSLADDCKDRAIGILLSGGGSDGTLGLRAIKDHGGITLAQGGNGSSPDHEDMSQAAITAGVVDLVLPVEEMGPRLSEFSRGFTQPADLPVPAEEGTAAIQAQQQIATILQSKTRHDFSGYKTGVFLRRVLRRMQLLQVTSLDSYVARLREDDEEPQHLYRDLLIGVTAFFRDSAAFEALNTLVIPRLFQNIAPGDQVRVWVPACATGEEAYSLAILLREHMETLASPPAVQVFATDLDEAAIETARTGRYHISELADVPTKRLRRFFIRDDSHCTITKDIRDMCVFSQHSVLENPPFSRLDLISCRNLLIYFGHHLQSQVLPLFHFALKPGRYLFLGTSENVSLHPDLFAVVDQKHRIFQRRDNALPVHPHLPRVQAGEILPAVRDGRGHLAMASTDLYDQVNRRILDQFAPAHVVVNREGDVLHYSARTGTYLEPAAGPPSRQLLTMAHKDLRQDLRTALREARDSHGRVERRNLSFKADGHARNVELVIEPIGASEDDPLFLVVFRDMGEQSQHRDAADATQSARHDRALGRVEEELSETRRRLQMMVEEYETAVEELQSSNEELQSINEELQSANEEMETSKEELQSVNEELNAVNAELQNRVEELDRANSDLRNVFESTQVAIIFLDRNLAIRTFTPAATALFKLIPGDRGRPLTDIASNLREIGDLRRDTHTVFEQGTTLERQVRHIDGHSHYLMRILPYWNERGAIDGTLIVFANVSHLVEYETRQQHLLAQANARITTVLDDTAWIAREAPTSNVTAEDYHRALLERLGAIKACHYMLAKADWQDPALSDILQSAMGRHFSRNRTRIALTGEPLHLPPVDAVALCTAVHELANNAVRYGSLSNRRGRLAINWQTVRAKGRQAVRIDWRESGGPAPAKPRRKGFGTKLIERAVNIQLGGSIAIEHTASGTHVRITIPVKTRTGSPPRS